ncbi:hypothetical protein DIU38_006300 [Mucilaginibacter sp. P4]|uniref:hypothetical protein n=1 Tax=Mucilaginibacter sp. P4 TaxID=3383180 RepID=UPI0011EEDCEE|nr:hypothetical protein [Mucilaginibacter gossypii]QEM15756.1 hypothetical protein DIU38_006300 [Mucilaginibacter gossypii]
MKSKFLSNFLMAAFTKRVLYFIPGDFIPGDFVPGEFVPRGFVPGTLYRDKVLSLCEKHKEQAEVGRSPTLLALRYRYGVLRILRGYFRAFLPVK